MGIVPAEILDRRRKAYASRGPRAAITREKERVSFLCKNMVSARSGIVNEDSFQSALLDSTNNDRSPLVQIMRTIVLEAWLRHIHTYGVLIESETGGQDLRRAMVATPESQFDDSLKYLN
jgi:hypothetical protein